MSRKIPRVIGTTEETIAAAEAELKFQFPPSFRSWLLVNNGLGVNGIAVFPVYDERDSRKTWNSIARNYQEGWAQWIDNFEGYGEPLSFAHLLPFAEVGNGDCYCFDYSRKQDNNEVPVVLWSHETGETKDRAATFSEFVEKAAKDEFEMD